MPLTWFTGRVRGFVPNFGAPSPFLRLDLTAARAKEAVQLWMRPQLRDRANEHHGRRAALARMRWVDLRVHPSWPVTSGIVGVQATQENEAARAQRNVLPDPLLMQVARVELGGIAQTGPVGCS